MPNFSWWLHNINSNISSGCGGNVNDRKQETHLFCGDEVETCKMLENAWKWAGCEFEDEKWEGLLLHEKSVKNQRDLEKI